MKRRYRKREYMERKWKKIALERIRILEEMKRKEPDFSERYDELISRIKRKFRLS